MNAGYLGRFDYDQLTYLRKDAAPFTCISLFSGCGGMDLGTHEAGFETRVMVEWDKSACDVLRLNWTGPGRTVEQEREPAILEEDIIKLPTHRILEAAGLRVGEATLLTGGFPCQGFSTARSGRNKDDYTYDDRNMLYKECVRVIREALPKTFVLENVKGLISMEKGRVIRMICDDLAAVGYNVTWDLLDAADYGVPQHRERVFFLGERVDVLALSGDRVQFHIGGERGKVRHPVWFEAGVPKSRWERANRQLAGQLSLFQQ